MLWRSLLATPSSVSATVSRSVSVVRPASARALELVVQGPFPAGGPGDRVRIVYPSIRPPQSNPTPQSPAGTVSRTRATRASRIDPDTWPARCSY